MGAPYSRPGYTTTTRESYHLPSESFVRCHGGPHDCYCSHRHSIPRLVWTERGGYGHRPRYLDPLQVMNRLNIQQNNYPGSGDVYADGPGAVGVGGMGGLGGANGMGGGFQGGVGMGMGVAWMPFALGGFGGLGWKDPQDWTTRDFECLQEVFSEMVARQRGRRRRGSRGGIDVDYGYDDNGYGDGEGGGRGRGSNHNIRDILALLQQLDIDTSRRLHGVERTVFGTQAEMRDAAFRQRLYTLFGNGNNANNNANDGPDLAGVNGGGGSGGNTGARFMQQQRDHERREREQRNLDREVDEIQRHLERLREQGERVGGVNGGVGWGWRFVDEWPFG